jgi:hypothetical protein
MQVSRTIAAENPIQRQTIPTINQAVMWISFSGIVAPLCMLASTIP